MLFHNVLDLTSENGKKIEKNAIHVIYNLLQYMRFVFILVTPEDAEYSTLPPCDPYGGYGYGYACGKSSLEIS